MNEDLHLTGFDAVWQRVMERDDEPITSKTAQKSELEQAICLVKQDNSSRAVRFIPKF